jgi:hypothetical protein
MAFVGATLCTGIMKELCRGIEAGQMAEAGTMVLVMLFMVHIMTAMV